MLGDYSKLITLLPNGQIRLNVIKEGDTEFDINKWIQLAINEFKNK